MRVGCGVCAETYPVFFVMHGEKAWFINYERFVLEENKGIEFICPFGAIRTE
jgi:ferredoxin